MLVLAPAAGRELAPAKAELLQGVAPLCITALSNRGPVVTSANPSAPLHQKHPSLCPAKRTKQAEWLAWHVSDR